MTETPRPVTAWGKSTGVGCCTKGRHITRDSRQRLPVTARIWQRGKQFLCVGVRGLGEQLLSRCLLNNLSGVHHCDLVCHLGHHTQVVGDQQHRHAIFLLCVAQQF